MYSLHGFSWDRLKKLVLSGVSSELLGLCMKQPWKARGRRWAGEYVRVNRPVSPLISSTLAAA